MTDKKRLHYDMIIAWANGKELEFFSQQSGQWEPANFPDFRKECQYRIAPHRHIYRRYLTRNTYGMVPRVYCLPWEIKDQFHPDKSSGFIKWIDEDWQVVEFDGE